ncbi:MAG TPA: tRNA pseudouridine(55) synthase TruB [Bryobacteraceae bacterium]|nr:tRNA pseudouridine(55) synthase TruB [Bryobacteraceae bacterium]
MDGVIVVDKEEGWTSHDVVGKMRRIANTKRIGHLGTLDPIATGVLPLVIGRATRLAQFYTRSDKVYEAIIRFGFATDTYDRAGAPASSAHEVRLDATDLERVLDSFRGEITQTPPPVSAKKVAGVRAYTLARRQETVDLAPATVRIYELTLLDIAGDTARVRAHCSGGTYMRSIAHDLGQALGCGAHLQDLRRISSAEFSLEQARTLAQLQQLAAEDRLHEALISAARMLPDFPSVYVEPLSAGQIRHGRNFPVSPFRVQAGTRYVKAVSEEEGLIAIGEAVLPNLYHPAVVL